MAKEDEILDTKSEGAPIQGVTGSPSRPGTVKFVTVDTDGHLQVDVLSGGGGGGSQFDDGDSIDTDSLGNLQIATTAIPGTARALRCDDDGALHIADGGNSITVDGTVAATQSGTWDINDITGTVSLPTGAATEVTSASILAELKLKADLTETQPVSAAALPLPTGAATSAGQLPDGHNVTVDNAAGASAVNIQDGGNSITTDPDTSVVDANNSTTTPLGASASFIGAGADCLGFSSITVIITTDFISALSGMKFQWSSDNTNWDDTISFEIDFTSGFTRRFQFPVTARYFRVNYTNGINAQTIFRVQTMLHRSNILTSIHRVDDTLGVDRSCTLVKSVITGNELFSDQYENISSVAALGLNLMPIIQVDVGGNLIDISANGEWHSLTASTDNTKANARYLTTDSNGNLLTSPGNSFSSVTHTEITVTNVSTAVLSSNSSRKFATFQNDSDTTIYLFFGTPAALNSGIRLNPNGAIYEINSSNLYTGQVTAIQSVVAGKNLTVSEG